MSFHLAYGDRAKSIGENKLGGLLVRFSNASQVDLQGEYFDATTDFWEWEWKAPKTVCWFHGRDKSLGPVVLGKSYLSRTPEGIEINATLDPEDWGREKREVAKKYIDQIMGMAREGLLGWSSSSSSLISRNRGKQITLWPIVEATLTPTPADPLNRVFSAKSIEEIGQIRDSWAAKSGAELSKANFMELDNARLAIQAGLSTLEGFLHDRNPTHNPSTQGIEPTTGNPLSSKAKAIANMLRLSSGR